MMKLCLPCNLVPNCTTVSCRPSMNDSCMCHISTAPDHSFGHRHIHQHMIPAAKTSQPTCAIALGSSCADTECSPPHRPHPHAPIRFPQAQSPAPACPPGTLHHSAGAQLHHTSRGHHHCNTSHTQGNATATTSNMHGAVPNTGYKTGLEFVMLS